jgi:hypothetical protein
MGRRRNWKWFSGIAAVIGCISSCTTEDSANENAANACTLIENDGGSVLHCGSGANIPLDGSGTFLANSTREEEGDNCENGGTRLEIGRDYDDDGVLDPKEVDSVQYVCSSATGTDTGHVLVAVTEEDAGDNCSNGGQLIQSGLDDNGNNVLDPEEIDTQHYVCNGTPGASGSTGDAGADGPASLVALTPVAGGNGSPCPDGGQLVEYGLDDDRDGVLDANEVDGSQYVCSGPQGSQGPTGPVGPAGDAGSDGVNTLVLVSIEDPGQNCDWGGQRIEWGLDDDRDGMLDVPPMQPASPLDGGTDAGDAAAPYSEVDGTSYVCNSAPGTLTIVTPEPQYHWYWNETCGTEWYWVWQGCWEGTFTDAGADAGSTYNPYCDVVWHWDYYGCQDRYYGGCFPTEGQRIDTGLDENRNGELDSDEIDSTAYVCDGVTSLVDVQAVATQVQECYYWGNWWCWNWQWVPGGPCDGEPGQQIYWGQDTNGNGSLEPWEHDGSEVVCSDGLNSLVDVQPVPTQVQECYYWGWWGSCWNWQWVSGGPCNGDPGQQIYWGLDDDRDEELDSNEIDGSQVVCGVAPSNE